MSSFPGTPRILKGGIVLLDPDTSAVLRIIVLQYNPDSLTRSLQVQGVGPTGGDRSEVLRLKGPPIETFKLEAELDATDQLEDPSDNPNTVNYGLFPALSALETMVYPTSSQLQQEIALGQNGTLEIAPMEAPLSLFIWSKQRIVPMRITEFSITEEAFDTNLNPIRARVSLSMRVLSVSDLPTDHIGTSLYLSYQQQKESMASKSNAGTLGAFGITGIF